MVKDLCFEIIEKCPNNCKFCSSNANILKKKIIEFEEFKRVIDYFETIGGIKEISLSGGEPLLHPDLLKMIAYTKQKNIKTVLFTSGIKYREKISDEEKKYYELKRQKDLSEIQTHEPWNHRLQSQVIRYYDNFLNPPLFSGLTKNDCQHLKALGLDKIVFDTQGYEEETDSYLMGRAKEKRQYLLDSIFYSATVGLNVDIHFIPLKFNYQEIGDLLELLEIIKVQNISFLKFIPQGRGKQNKNFLELEPKELKNFLKNLEQEAKKFSGKIRCGIPLQTSTKHKCNAGLEKLVIKCDGTILPCPALKDLTEEEYREYGIKIYHIKNLNEIKIPGYGTRVEPLCQKYLKRQRSKE